MDSAAARDFALRFLHLMEERNLDAAEALVAPDARIVFPGGKVFASQRDMVAASKGRYQWIKKRIEQVDAFQNDNGDWIVYVIGTLYGASTSGTAFENIRFIDRFTLHEDLIIAQEVWNDLAESGALESPTPPR